MIKILIADDEPIERELVSKIIEKNFADTLEIVAAPNGRVAVQKFIENKPKICVLDINMPGISGLEAAQQIRELDSQCEIIFLTAYDEFDYARKAISVRAMEYMLKPTKSSELVAVLEKAVSHFLEEVTADVWSKEDTSETIDDSDSTRLNVIAGVISDYIVENYTNDISLQDMASHLHYSDAYFSKVFKQCFDKGFIVYLNEFRINKAKEYLSDISVNIKDISEKVGYRDSNYFAKVFKRSEGVTPSEYRLKILGKC